MSIEPRRVPNGDLFDPTTITRPAPALLKYYIFVSLLSGPLFPFTFIPFWLRYTTLRYQFDESGISMRWGVIFRREIHLTYRRIQDIHLTRNLFQRWMGLATVGVQTASGGSAPEMSIEGILAADELRDYLYAQMRGARDGVTPTAQKISGDSELDTDAQGDESLLLLKEIRDLLRRRDQQPEQSP